jgi:hypothetical protein
VGTSESGCRIESIDGELRSSCASRAAASQAPRNTAATVH